jgi:mRNA interferase RelE/StbE
MPWTYEIDAAALADLRRLGPSTETAIRTWLEKRVKGATNPRLFGKPLRGRLHGLWRYRVPDYRLLCQLQDHRLVVLVITIGHRSAIYED